MLENDSAVNVKSTEYCLIFFFGVFCYYESVLFLLDYTFTERERGPRELLEVERSEFRCHACDEREGDSLSRC